MCGIAGFVRKRTDSAATDLVLDRMKARIAHRGPDGEGSHISESGDWTAALGHRRLSIIDLEGGRQPLSNEDDTVWITFNGEIYNYKSLRSRLESQGHRFKTHSDTEVLLHHLEENGTDGLGDFNGMFAFALWDRSQGRLLLGRDRAGIKPLYYAPTSDGGVAFASELAALFEHPLVPRKIDAQAVGAYFFSDYVHSPQTIIHGIYKLDPGHYLVWENGTLHAPKAFWTLGAGVAAMTAPLTDEKAMAEELRQRLSRAVASQLMSDVPLGVLLSGGLDSSIVAALAQKEVKGELHTFSIGFDDPAFDESSFARQVSRHIGSRHTEEIFKEKQVLDMLDAALGSLDEPMADPSILPTFLLAQLTAKSVKVVLGGDGGDELFAGYPTYRAHDYARTYERIPSFLREKLIKPFVGFLRVGQGYQPIEWKLKRFTHRWDDESMRRHLRWMSATDLPQLDELMRGKAGVPPVLAGANRPRFDDPVNSLLALDFSTYMPGSVLPKVDRASMAWGLEVRPPFLDNEVIDWAFSLPSSVKLRGSATKYLLKKAAETELPHEIIYRKKKGFAIPLSKWLRGPLKSRLDVIFHDSPVWFITADDQSRLINRDVAFMMNERHQSHREDFSKPLWALIVLDSWLRRERHHVTL